MKVSLDDVRKTINDGADFNIAYITMNCLAAIIASYGLFANSPAVVIGAMIVAMLLGPIAGFALGLTDANFNLLKKSALTLIGGVLGVYLTALIIGYFHQSSAITNEIIARTSPNLFDLMIALAGGAAGAYSMVSPRLSVAFVGVAIATALVPPLSSSAILLARGQYKLAFGAFLLAFTNIVAIQFACSLVMWLSGYHKQVENSIFSFGFLKNQAVTLILLALLGIFLTNNLITLVQNEQFQNETKKIIASKIRNKQGANLAEVRFDSDTTDKMIVIAVIRSPQQFSPQEAAEIESSMPKSPNGKLIELRLRVVSVDVLTKNGKVFVDDDEIVQKEER